jgi:2'-5' RNA ligase
VGDKRLEEAVALSARVRAFFGLPLPKDHREALGAYIASCATIAPEFRWVPAANLHLTVRFIGGIERDLVAGIAARLAESPLRAFDLALGDLGTFQRGRLVRVVWMGVSAGVEAARGLAGQVEAACVAAGLGPETRQFQAHLTLARARSRLGAALPQLPDPPRLGPWQADELVLYESHLSPKGSVYEPLRALHMD